MTNERKFKKAYAKELLEIATGDLETAKGIESIKRGRKENLLFHVQQSIEKTLKAVLCHRERSVPLIHELSLLVDRLSDIGPIPHSELIVDLSQFATIRRYEEGVAEITDEEVTQAISAAEEIVAWAVAIIQEK